MDPNELLPAAREQFQAAFLQAVKDCLPTLQENIFKLAEAARSSSEQANLLHAYTISRKADALLAQLESCLDALLTRSFQTTYNTFRPSSLLSIESSGLSLLDSSVLENELMLNETTANFRTEAEDQIRDLNIRIALIFGQETIKERENPFRPYILTRCIANALNELKLQPDLSRIMHEQLAYVLRRYIQGIYEKINQMLATHGIAAELQFKIRKTGAPQPAPVFPGTNTINSPAAPYSSGQGNEQFSAQYAAQYAGIQAAHHSHTESMSAIHGQAEDFRPPAMDLPAPGRLEQLLAKVRGVAASGAPQTQSLNNNLYNSATTPTAMNTTASLAQAAMGQMPAKSTASMNPGWLSKQGSIGKAIRQLFAPAPPHPAQADAVQTPDALQFHSASHPADGAELLPAGSGMANYPDGEFSAAAPTSSAEATTSQASWQENLPPAPVSGIVQSVYYLQKAFQTPVEHMFNQYGEIRNLILEQRSSLNEMTQDVDEQMTIDVVAMLFEFILSDHTVPAEIRAQLGRLQFLVLKVALRDPSLLTQKGHPARMLINRVGSISLGLKQIDPTGADIADEICRIVETLLDDDSESALLFTRMLDELDAFIAKKLRESDEHIAITVNTVEDVQHRALRLLHISAQLHEALHALNMDAYLEQFLETSWVQAIEFAERNDEKRGIRYRLTVPDLLWSILPKLEQEDKTQLFALLPLILNTLREGLGHIAFAPAELQQLMDWLVDAHTRALRAAPGPDNERLYTLPALHELFSGFTCQTEASKHIDAELAASETQKILEQAIQDLDIQVQLLDKEVDTALLASLPEADSVLNNDTIRERLRCGVSLEVNLGIKPTSGKLNWVDPEQNHLVLSLAGTPEPSVVSVRMFRRMIAHGRVRFLEAEPLFERAVQALLTNADMLDTPVA
ncbi:DUF1631 family protein [Undibacterium rugosum]|nr:DUF1631 family protein [Undibacterium rugosum]MBR7777745.1 DUF1631 family protein [Undibacterium rugosum]